MRFLHTADWHLGRLFHAVHLTEDQAYLLDQVVELVRDAHPDVVLIAGDVYDRAVPPPEAVALLNDVLSRLVLGCRTPVVVIAGNHDSPSRLGFASQLLRGTGLHLFGELDAAAEPTTLADKAGPVRIYGLPFAEPAVVRERLSPRSAPGGATQSEEATGLNRRPAIHDQDSAVRTLTEEIRSNHPPGARSILVAHAFVAGGAASESERPLSVGGAEQVDPQCFTGFGFVALGHLHRPQAVGDGPIHYAGSLMKYSFGESGDSKSVNLVEMDGKGHCRVERVVLRPRRDVRRVQGRLADLLKGPSSGESREDYLLAVLLDPGPVLDAIGRLREVYPNVLGLERPFLDVDGSRSRPVADHRNLTDLDLFKAFYESVASEPLSEIEAATLTAVLTTLRRELETAK